MIKLYRTEVCVRDSRIVQFTIILNETFVFVNIITSCPAIA